MVIPCLFSQVTEQQRDLSKRLAKLEKGNNTADGSNAKDDDDDQPSIYPVLPVLADILRGQLGNDTDLHVRISLSFSTCVKFKLHGMCNVHTKAIFKKLQL